MEIEGHYEILVQPYRAEHCSFASIWIGLDVAKYWLNAISLP